MSLYNTEPDFNHELIVLDRNSWDELHPLLQRLATKFAEKGFYVGAGIGLADDGEIPYQHDQKGQISFSNQRTVPETESNTLLVIHYGTSSAEDGWENYADVGEQLNFALKGLEGVEFEYDRGSGIKLQSLP